MKTFTDFQTEWKDFCQSTPDVYNNLEKEIVPLLLQTDIDDVHRGMEKLLSFGEIALCFLLQEDGDQVRLDISSSLAKMNTKNLKDILRSHSIKMSGRKTQLVQRIHNAYSWRGPIRKYLLEKVNRTDSAWFGLADSGAFDDMKEMVEIPEKNYAIGRYPVTQTLWESVMGSNPSHFKGISQPVEKVSWFDCVVFCNKLSEKEGLEKAYQINGKLPKDWNDPGPDVACNFESNGYRLPTEWEWFFAAKANQDVQYAGSDTVDDVAWYERNSNRQTQSVGQKKANGFGLYDMSGNINEWCWDLDGEDDILFTTPTENSTGPSTGTYRMIRGGCCYDHANCSRLSWRSIGNPFSGSSRTGFRLCLTTL